MKEILIEQMLFGDYRVNVWDENKNSVLDKEYFCRGLTSATLTAHAIKIDLFPDARVAYYPPL